MQTESVAVAAAVRDEYRAFLYGLFAHNPRRRRFVLWQWLCNYRVGNCGGGIAAALRDVWRAILESLLWARAALVVESTLFEVLGAAFPVRYEWLDARERHFIVHSLFRHRKALFGDVRVLPNNAVRLSGFVCDSADGDAFDGVWRRQLVRDLAAWVAPCGGHVALEFVCAVQRTAVERGDPFLCELYAALMGHGPAAALPCWGHGEADAVRPREETLSERENVN